MKEDLVSSVEAIIRQAGSIIMSHYNKHLTQFNKDGGSSFATEADLESEKYLLESLHALIPEACFFAEESGKSGGERELCWVIDPLDGTTNFAHGFYYFCISVALTQNDIPIFGMIYDPVRDEVFHAEKGKGAYLNGKKIAVKSPDLSESLLLISLPYNKEDRRSCDIMVNVRTDARAVRQLGSAALDQVNVACGRADGLFFTGLAWWDIAAGMLILKEAGAQVSTFERAQPRPDYKSYVAASPALYTQLLPYLR
jgi:myo-inositol-1(or 4)-monophosphatase